MFFKDLVPFQQHDIIRKDMAVYVRQSVFAHYRPGEDWASEGNSVPMILHKI